jgi:hypothetical protein
MIISLAHRFVFIKTIKTAGSSIEVVLSGLCEEGAIVTPLYPPEPSHRPRNFAPLGFEPHMGAAAIRQRIGPALWDRLAKITVERNPWDKMVSWYGWQRHLAGLDCDFPAFIGHCAECGRWPYLFPAAAELYIIAGRPCVDHVIRFEHLAEDFAATFGSLCGGAALALPYAKAGHRPAGAGYRAFYDRPTIEYVARRYAREISLFDYAF